MKYLTHIPKISGAFVLFLAVFANSLSAQLYVYEGFDYTKPSLIQYSGTGEIADNSVDGAINLTNVTSVQRSQNWMTSGLADISSNTLSYSAGANSLVTGSGMATMRNARGIRYYTNAFAATGGSVYGSYLWKTVQNGSGEWNGHFELRNGGAGLDARIGVGLIDNTNTNLQVRYGATSYDTGFALSNDTPYLVSFKADYNGSGQMTSLGVWINAGDLTSEVGSGAATYSQSGVIGGGGFGGMILDKGNLSGVLPTFANIRIGGDWESVHPVPEPSTYALIFGGLVGVLVLLRRARSKKL